MNLWYLVKHIDKQKKQWERKEKKKIAEICFCLINYATNNGGLKFGLYLARINIWRSEPKPRSIWCWSRSVRVRQGGRVRPNAVVLLMWIEHVALWQLLIIEREHSWRSCFQFKLVKWTQRFIRVPSSFYRNGKIFFYLN